MTRAQIEQEIERLIDMLDAMDGDADSEVETDFDVNPTSLDYDRRPVRRIRRAA